MPRGGARAGAGRKADPNSRRQKALVAKAAKKASGAPRKRKSLGRGLTLPDGRKSPEAPPGWPFGTQPPADPPQGTLPAPDPDSDDGLSDEERAGLSPLEYLLAVMRSSKASKNSRLTAAIQAAPYMHPKLVPKGKKEGALDEAKARKPGGRFAAAAPPRLASAGGKRVS